MRPCLFVTDKTCVLFQVPVLLVAHTVEHKQAHQPLSYCNQPDHGLPLYYNYANDTTLTSDSKPGSTIAVVGPTGFPCVNHKERVNLPVERSEIESHKLTTATSVPSCILIFIHSFISSTT